MSTLHYQILCRAREIISDKKHWVQFDVRRWSHRGYFRYCAWGAMRQASREIANDRDYYQRYISEVSMESLIETNDFGGHAAVLKRMDTLIARVGRRPGRRPKSIIRSTSLAPKQCVQRMAEVA
jgi:hypothetical protein